MISLFDGVRSPGLVASLLELGLDSVVARPWEDASLLARLRQAPAPGTYKVEEYGEILASVREGQGSMTDLTLPDLPEEKKARRILRIIRKGLTQLSGKHTGVLVVGLFHFAHPLRVEQLVSEAAKKYDADYARCQMITLCDSVTDPEGRSRIRTTSPVFHAFSPRAYRHLRKGELELAQTVASRHMRPAARLRPARPGDVAVTLNTTRPARSLVSLGTVRGLQAGQTVTFTLNGRGETSMEVSPTDPANDE